MGRSSSMGDDVPGIRRRLFVLSPNRRGPQAENRPFATSGQSDGEIGHYAGFPQDGAGRRYAISNLFIFETHKI